MPDVLAEAVVKGDSRVSDLGRVDHCQGAHRGPPVRAIACRVSLYGFAGHKGYGTKALPAGAGFKARRLRTGAPSRRGRYAARDAA